MSSVVFATQPYSTVSSALLDSDGWFGAPTARMDMSWTPTAKRGTRRVGRGSRGRRSQTEEGMPDRMEILYTRVHMLVSSS